MIDFSKQSIDVEPSLVTYRSSVGAGILVVRVFLMSSNPRIQVYSTNGREDYPGSLFLDEINDFVVDAQKRVEELG